MSFLAYAVFGSDGPLRTRVQEYSVERERRTVVRDLIEGQVSRTPTGDGTSPTVVEFVDFQCPYCRDMHEMLRRAEAEGRLRVVLMHLPLERIHPLANPAAKASLCAEAQGSAESMNHLLMSTRGWMEEADWGRLARAAGVPSSDAFETCLEAQATEDELARHVAVARSIGVRATPTFVSYGGIHSGVATLEQLVDLARN